MVASRKCRSQRPPLYSSARHAAWLVPAPTKYPIHPTQTCTMSRGGRPDAGPALSDDPTLALAPAAPVRPPRRTAPPPFLPPHSPTLSAQAASPKRRATGKAAAEGVPLRRPVDVTARRCAAGFPLEPPRRESVREFDIFAFGNRPKPRLPARRPSFNSRMHRSPLLPAPAPSRGGGRPGGRATPPNSAPISPSRAHCGQGASAARATPNRRSRRRR